MELNALISEIQEDVFAYNVAGLPMKVTSLFEQLLAGHLITSLDAGDMQRFNKMFEACLFALQNKDYLRLADVLEYEIRPLLGLLLN